MIRTNLLLAGDDAYNLTKSLRFRKSASGYLNRTPASAGNQQIFTFSYWVKRGNLASQTYLAGNIVYAGSGSTNEQFNIYFGTNDCLEISSYANSGFAYRLITTQVFRDPSAWYHIVIAFDTTQATSSNRIKLYVNGTQVTSFSTASYPSQNLNTYWNRAIRSGLGAIIGTVDGSNYQDGASYFDGYIAETYFINGQQLTPSSFGSTNALTGVWQPAKYTGTYGTNGFYLPFTNTTSTTTLGYDFSGNSNNWTTNNLSLTAGSTYDSMNDVPTLTSATIANYPTLNAVNSNATLSRANLQSLSPSTNWLDAISTMAFPIGTGKWYLEATNSSNSYECLLGVTNTTITAGNTDNYRCAYSSGGLVVRAGYGQGDTTVSTYTVNDVIGMAVDCAAGTVSFYKNNTFINTTTATDFTTKQLIAFTRQNNAGFNINFGQQPFTYTPPTGYVALNTYNLPTSTIVKGNTVMDATLYSGNGSTQTITNAAPFKPDFVWIKERSSTSSNTLSDSVRGAGSILLSDSTAAESTGQVALTSFNTNGFSVGADGKTNESSQTYVARQWQAGQGSSSSNTNGSITSTVSVNATAGFSVATFTSPASGAFTVGHGLGIVPGFVITKIRSATDNWHVWHSSLGGTQYLNMNLTDAVGTNANVFSATPTSSVINIGSNTAGSYTVVAYCWSEITGFSKFGSYTGNGSTDGPFIYTGFRPRFVIFKRSDSTGNWQMIDTSINPYNNAGTDLFTNLANAETSGYAFDILSNGFKQRDNGAGQNASGGTYIYMAFAENPFKNALAR